MPIRTLDDLDAAGTTVGVRVDINSPIAEDGGLADDARFQAHLETLSELLDRGARVAILAHQGRPGGEEFTDLSAHADRLDDLLSAPVGYTDGTFSASARDAVANLADGTALVLENTRFYSEEYMEWDPEKAADTFLVARLSAELDAFVNDAFAASHRAQPSLVGFTERLPSYAGRVMEAELDALGDIGQSPEPRVYVLGGAKVEDSLEVARRILDRDLATEVLTTGVVGNTFLVASGTDPGEETVAFVRERYADAIEEATAILEEYGDRIRVPDDVAIDREGERLEVPVEDLPVAESALDIGQGTIESYSRVLADAGTAILNGPAGVFEDERFSTGTREVFRAATRAEFSIVGGGDTAAALRELGLEGFDHVSTGGGAALNILSGETLVAVEALR